jgi:hypothetical protein
MISLFGMDPKNYDGSRLHAADRTFRETNCYTDIWIELLHAAGFDPAAAMSFCAAIDFEGDQWSFIKPPVDALENMFGIDVHEMQLYRPLLKHLETLLRNGRTMIVEVDSFYLPDTRGTTYGQAHVKSSIAVEALDVDQKILHYFHGPSLFALSGEDFDGVFRLGRSFSDDVLPPYVEMVDFARNLPLEGDALRQTARKSLALQISRRPKQNPWRAFANQLVVDLPELLQGDERDYHAYAFATVRQSGAAFECLQSFVEWLNRDSEGLPSKNETHSANMVSDLLGRQVAGSKALLFKLARRKSFDVTAAIAPLAAEWDLVMHHLELLATDDDECLKEQVLSPQ